VGDPALKMAKKCSFTAVNSAFLAIFALSRRPRLRFSTACEGAAAGRANRTVERWSAGLPLGHMTRLDGDSQTMFSYVI
jgi:hypothetical protein